MPTLNVIYVMCILVYYLVYSVYTLYTLCIELLCGRYQERTMGERITFEHSR